LCLVLLARHTLGVPVIAYPFDRLPRISSGGIPLLRAIAAHLGAQAQATALAWGRDCVGVAELGVRVTSVTPLSADAALWQRLVAAERFELEGPPPTKVALIADGALVGEVARRIARAPASGGAHATRGERGLVGYGLAWLLASLPLGASWELQERPPPLEDYQQAWALSLQLDLGDRGATAWLLAFAPDVALLPVAPAPARERPSWWPTLPLELAVEVGRFALRASELAALAAGDTIVAETLPSTLDGAEAWLAVDAGGLAGRIDGDRLALEGWRRHGPWVLAANEEKSMAAENKGLVDELELEVVVELARIKLTAGELSELGAGDVLQLGRPLVAPLELRVGGRAIARCELVDVDGEAGLRVLDVAE
jgi:type III secretion system YscQ/HrcQ family protein